MTEENSEENANQNDFIEQARNLVEKIGSKNGIIRNAKQLNKEDLAVIVWASDRVGDYRYDTAYLVWKNKNELKGREIADSKGTKEYIHINDIIENGEDIFIKLNYTHPICDNKYKNNRESKYRIKKKDL